MEKIPFESQKVEGLESVMSVQDLNVSEIRFKHDTREIFVVYQKTNKYTKEDFADSNWQAVKKLVLAEGGEWANKKVGIQFLLGVTL